VEFVKGFVRMNFDFDYFDLREVPSGKPEPSGRASTSASDSSRQVSRQVKIFSNENLDVS
jgi:hypothetical protein